MFYTATQIKAASLALDEARRTFNCPAPRVDADGKAAHAHNPSLPYGEHGAAFLQVDPATLEVRCGACAGEMDATVTPKREVIDRRSGRTHFVSQ